MRYFLTILLLTAFVLPFLEKGKKKHKDCVSPVAQPWQVD
jgi:hypothetical protein